MQEYAGLKAGSEQLGIWAIFEVKLLQFFSVVERQFKGQRMWPSTRGPWHFHQPPLKESGIGPENCSTVATFDAKLLRYLVCSETEGVSGF